VIKSRKKVGFNAPIFSFLDVRDKKVKEYLLDDSFIYEYVVKKKIEDMLNKDDLVNSESKLLFSFLCAKIFLEEFH
jgi:asparagine synthase (glutamine-hydrolysing)